MPYELGSRLVIGVASSAMFDLTESDTVFRTKGEEEYRKYQTKHVDVPLPKGPSFSFVKRLLSLNNLTDDPKSDPLVEVVLLSRNDPDTGLRVMKSIKHHNLPISRAIFMQGKSPYDYIPALSISLFLSGNSFDVKEAIRLGYPAGHVMKSAIIDEDDDDLRIAFDFDGVLADDESETVMHNTNDLNQFHEHETKNVLQPHNPGPLKEFLVKVSAIQKIEENKKKHDPAYRNRLRVSIVTARNAPSHERALNTLKEWGVMTNDAFFLGGVDKGLILGVLKPHIFFDDQSGHISSTSTVAPSVHIPFGVKNAVDSNEVEVSN
ncbi:5'-nucleotidase [Psychromonas sp. B3M02]|uniref:5'-nucleotidase n=1 Tax=Psychromonas sp. B3M02 TaxID=2267226 RepID=UPI000DEBDB45|nr:5'-nucleotidase [Psychromonas sp. B3M02]RBW46533.1 5'-nucleotidase [Psychromonas sp. B3M02]